MMNVSLGGVDTCLSVIEAYDKDKGFKKALEDLKKGYVGKKKTEKDVADQEARLKQAGDTAHRKELNASKALEALASKKGEIAQSESELELAREAFKADMALKQADLTAANKALESENERLKALDGQLKALQSDLLEKSEKLIVDKAAFEAWRTKIRSALAA